MEEPPGDDVYCVRLWKWVFPKCVDRDDHLYNEDLQPPRGKEEPVPTQRVWKGHLAIRYPPLQSEEQGEEREGGLER